MIFKNLNSNQTGSNRLKESYTKDSTGNSNNPDFLNIYDEGNNINKNLISTENNKHSNKNKEFVSEKISLKYDMIINKNINNNIYNKSDKINNSTIIDILATESNNNLINDNDNLKRENIHKNCITDVNLNYIESETQNNILPIEMENFLNRRNNHNDENMNFLETTQENKIRESKNNINTQSNSYTKCKQSGKLISNPNKSVRDYTDLPEYLPTEINNIITSSQDLNKSYYQETENINNNLKTSNKFDKETNNYSNYVCHTDIDGGLITNVNKTDENYLNTSQNINNMRLITNNNVLQEDNINNNYDNDNTNNSLDKKNYLISNNKLNNQIDNIDNLIVDGKNNLKIKTQKVETSNNRKLIFNCNSKSPEIKRNIIFDKGNYHSKNTNNIIIKNLHNTHKYNITNNSFNEDIINTENSTNKYENYMKKNFGKVIKTNIVRNQCDQYLRALIRTNVENFKKGFFNTSVSYEKSPGIRNRTFDNKFNQTSKSKSKERSPISNGLYISNIVNKKNLNKADKGFKKENVDNRLNIYKFQTNNTKNINSKNNSKDKSNSKCKDNNEIKNNTNKRSNNDKNKNDGLEKTQLDKKMNILNKTFNKNVHLNNIKSGYKYM